MQVVPGLRTDVRLRPATADDREFLFRVYAGTREEELAAVPWSDEQRSAFLRMQFEAQRRHYETHFPAADFSIIEREGVPIGRLYVDRRADEIRIVDIALLPAQRGAGIGGALVRGLLAEAQGARKPVRIHVEQGNRAHRFYERLGFVKTGDTGVYHLLEWTPAPS